MQQNLLRMKAAIAEWLTKEGWLGDAGFYTVDQWRAREEEWLTDSLLVLVFDGSSLHTMLNFGGDHDEFDDLVQSFGFYYELGNHWNMGFYPLSAFRALCRTCHGSRAQVEIRMRAYMATLSQSYMERLREGLGRAFGFFEDDAVLSFLERVGPRDDHLSAASAVLAQGIRDDYR